jgi:hypothetical protein
MGLLLAMVELLFKAVCAASSFLCCDESLKTNWLFLFSTNSNGSLLSQSIFWVSLFEKHTLNPA